MSSSGSVSDRIRRNDKSLTYVALREGDDPVEILDALKTTTVVKKVAIFSQAQMNEEAYVKLLEVMKCNKSVESLTISLGRSLLRERLFAVIATSGGWSSIHELVISDDPRHMSLRVSEDISNFVLQTENLRTLKLDMAGDQTAAIIEILSLNGTKVQTLNIDISQISSMTNGGRRLAAALERCTCITELRLALTVLDDPMEFFQMLFIKSIPKMLGLKKIKLAIFRQHDQGFFDMVGGCIGGHQGGIEELTLFVCLIL
jgi:hypothetical protein